MSKTSIAALTNLQERTNRSAGKYESSYAKNLVTAQRRLLNAIEGITQMNETRNSLETPAAHAVKIAKAASKLAAEAGKIKETAYQEYMQYSVSLTTAIHERAGVQENKYASEIRAAYRALPFDERMPFIQKMIEQVDGASFAAIMQAPALLTGIDPEMNRQLTEAFYLKAAPDLYQEKQDLNEAMDCVAASLKIVEGDTRAYQDPELINRVDSEVKLSAEAADRFNAALAA